jgi:4'-phosphopantetheinyl transferase
MNARMSQSSTWSEPPPSLSLESGEVHVWRISLEQPDEVHTRFRGTLERDELERATRFYFEKHRRHFVVGRGSLRYIIGRYLQEQPEGLRFTYGVYGKPSLAGEQALRFNLSHSHEVALLAVARGVELGVDVERVREDFATEDIARRYFSTVEVDAFNLLPREEQVAAFFRCWTRKEAYIKAIGKGLSQPLDQFDVAFGPGERAALLRAQEDDAARWEMSDIDVGEGYAGALAVERPVGEIRYFRQDSQDLAESTG